MGPCGFEHVEEAREVVAVVLDRLRNGFSHSLERCEVDDRVYVVLCEKAVYSLRITEIHLDERYVILARDLLYSFEAGEIAVGHVVGNDDVVAGLYQFNGDMAADESGSARDQYAFCHI